MTSRAARDVLMPEALGYLKLLREAADHESASPAESEALGGLFLDACRRYGLDAETMSVAIEVLL